MALPINLDLEQNAKPQGVMNVEAIKPARRSNGGKFLVGGLLMLAIAAGITVAVYFATKKDTPADGIAVQALSVEFLAAGDVADFSASKRQSILETLATTAGFLATPVGSALAVTPASVKIIATFPVSDASALQTRQAQLSANLPNQASLATLLSGVATVESAAIIASVETTVPSPELHALEPQWRDVHGYWQGTCVSLDQNGNEGAPYARWAVVSTSGSTYQEMTTRAGGSGWTVDVEGDAVLEHHTAVEKSENGVVRMRTQAAGNGNAFWSGFYDQAGVLTHSRLTSFRTTGGVLRRIVSTQAFSGGFEPAGLIECNDQKLAGRPTADEALATAGLATTPEPALVVPIVPTVLANKTVVACAVESVVLSDYPQWADEHGYWMGEYSYFGANLQPNYVPDSWNYPYDHYRGFITGSVDKGSYSQRNTFFYPPQTTELCATNNNTFLADEACGSTGATKTFQADQTTELCDALDGGRISGPYGSDSTTTTLIGTQAVLYQIWSADTNGDLVFYQSQITTITKSGERVRRTRTAQFFDKDSGLPSWFSFYRELKVSETAFWTAFNATKDEYHVSDAAIAERCHGGFANLKQFMEGSMDWSGDKYECPIKMESSDGAAAQPAIWTDTGVTGWAGYYASDPMTAGNYITASQLAKVPGATVTSLTGYGWLDPLAAALAIWTDAGVTGWAGYYASDPMTAGNLITASQLAKVPGATVTSLTGYGWLDPLATPLAIWTDTGVTGWAGYYASDPMTAGNYITASQLAKVPGATVTSLTGYGWLDPLATA